MNIMHLKYAVEVAKAGSINKASEVLLMGQPNLSRAIKELESSLGITIFKRSAKGMVVTPQGEEFLSYAVKILRQIDEVEAIYKAGAPVKQRFSISVPRASYISEAFARFSKSIRKDRPAELFYQETNSMRAVNNILHSDYKLGIIRYAENDDRYFREMLEEKGLTYELVTEFSYVLIMSKNSPLAPKEEIRFADLRPFTEIAHADPSVPSLPGASARKEELPDDIDRHIFIFERASQFELLSENTDTFMWVSPIPDRLLSRYDLVQKPCRDNRRIYKDMLIYRENYRLTDLDNRFINELCQSKRQYL
ncbi:MAG: LysR family transcriptional regulator [Acutalibacteraceae bacterium]